MVTELIRIDSDDSDSEKNLMSNIEGSQVVLNSNNFDNWMRENRENMVSFREPSFNDLNPYAIQGESELSLGAEMVANPFII